MSEDAGDARFDVVLVADDDVWLAVVDVDVRQVACRTVAAHIVLACRQTPTHKQLAAVAVLLGGLGSRVVSVLDSGAEGPGFKSQPRHCRVTVLGKLFTPSGVTRILTQGGAQTLSLFSPFPPLPFTSLYLSLIHI